MCEMMKLSIGKVDKQEVYWEVNNIAYSQYSNFAYFSKKALPGMANMMTQNRVALQFQNQWNKNVNHTATSVLIFDIESNNQMYYPTMIEEEDPDSKFMDREESELRRKFIQLGRNPLLYSYMVTLNPLRVLYSDEDKDKNMPNQRAQAVADIIMRSFNLSQIEKIEIEQLIMQCYYDFGITSDPTTWNRTAPTLFTVAEKGSNNENVKDALEDLGYTAPFSALDTACTYANNWLTGSKIIYLDNLEKNVQNATVGLVSNIIYEEMKLSGESELKGFSREMRTMIVFDKAEQILQCEFPSVRKMLRYGQQLGIATISVFSDVSYIVKGNTKYQKYFPLWVVEEYAGEIDPECASFLVGSDFKKHISRSLLLGYYMSSFIRNEDKVEKINLAGDVWYFCDWFTGNLV